KCPGRCAAFPPACRARAFPGAKGRSSRPHYLSRRGKYFETTKLQLRHARLVALADAHRVAVAGQAARGLEALDDDHRHDSARGAPAEHAVDHGEHREVEPAALELGALPKLEVAAHLSVRHLEMPRQRPHCGLGAAHFTRRLAL